MNSAEKSVELLPFTAMENKVETPIVIDIVPIHLLTGIIIIMEIKDIKEQIKEQLNSSTKKHQIDKARYKLISLIEYTERHGIALNDLLEEYNSLRKTEL